MNPYQRVPSMDFRFDWDTRITLSACLKANASNSRKMSLLYVTFTVHLNRHSMGYFIDLMLFIHLIMMDIWVGKLLNELKLFIVKIQLTFASSSFLC